MGSIAGTAPGTPGTLRCATVLMAHGVAGTATVGGGRKGCFQVGGLEAGGELEVCGELEAGRELVLAVAAVGTAILEGRGDMEEEKGEHALLAHAMGEESQWGPASFAMPEAWRGRMQVREGQVQGNCPGKRGRHQISSTRISPLPWKGCLGVGSTPGSKATPRDVGALTSGG